jgi:hypothetical protein
MAEEFCFAVRCRGSVQRPAFKRKCSQCVTHCSYLREMDSHHVPVPTNGLLAESTSFCSHLVQTFMKLWDYDYHNSLDVSDFREDFSTEYQTEGLSNNTVVWRYISDYLIYLRWSQLSGLNKLFSLITDVALLKKKKRSFLWKAKLKSLKNFNYRLYPMTDDNKNKYECRI